MLSRPRPADPSPPAPSPQNRTMLAETEAMIRYNCPRCKKSLESPASFAGQKLNCPECNQRLQIPKPAAPPPPPLPLNKTILAGEDAHAPAPPPPAPIPVAAPPAPELTPWRPTKGQRQEPEEEYERPARREGCLECGIDVTNRARVQTCPDCGSVLC